MKKHKLVTLVGTRPELIRLSRLIPVLDDFFDHTLVHSGQNFTSELRDVFFKDLLIREPDVSYATDPSSLASSISSSFISLERVLEQIRPDAFVCLGDTTSALGLILARKMGIITYHLEAGNRSFDDRVPEEINRRTIDHTSDFNLTYSRRSYENLMRESLSPRFSSMSGSPIGEIMNFYRHAIEDSQVLNAVGMDDGQFLLFSLHRQETVNSPDKLARALQCLERAVQVTESPAIVTLHPRTESKIKEFGLKMPSDTVVHKPFGFLDYQKLQATARVTLSDSGTLAEEALISGFKALLLRESTERPEAVESGGITMTGLEPGYVEQHITRLLGLGSTPYRLPEGYEELHFSSRVANYIGSTLPFARQWKSLV